MKVGLKLLAGCAKAALAGMAFCALGATAHAQDKAFPNKPIRLVVPFSPGGSVDNIARPLAQYMSEALGQQVIVDSKPGAAGNIGVELVAQSPADGYTLLIGNVSTNGINPSLYAERLKIDPAKDLRTLALVGAAPGVLAASPKFPANNVAELIKYAKANPKTYNHASAGAGSYAMIDLLRLEKAAGMELVHVPYKGAGQFIAALMADEVQVAFINASTSIPQVQGGRLKALAVTTKERMPQLPNVQTMAEAGYPGIGTNSWHAVFVPSATPEPVVKTLFAVVRKVTSNPQFIEQLQKMSIEPLQSASPAEAQAFVQREARAWAGVIKEHNVGID